MIQLHKDFEAQSGYNKVKQLFVNTRNVVANPSRQNKQTKIRGHSITEWTR